MPIWKAIILGIVQGAAEFLPVSSSGHLVIFKEVLGIDMESGGVFFDVMLHLGTLLAVFVAFRKDIIHLFIEGLHIVGDFFTNCFIFIRNIFGADLPYRKIIKSSYRKMVMLIIVSTIPTGILGILLSDIVEMANSIIIVPGVCLLITAMFLFIADAVELGDKKPRDIGYGNAGFVGIVQGLATMPGVSRSGSTITACLLCGYNKKFAVKYSFIMSIPAVLGAVCLEIKDLTKVNLSGDMIGSCVIATLVAALVGYISICVMMRIIRGKKYKYFGIYCIVLGLIAIGSYFII